ncbi:MAG: tRNA-dihydrouridine synthase family protein [Treponema sp.]|nr:tRNA-dihydrouridine synthase family protein [Candidatus Treponema scatequi]
MKKLIAGPMATLSHQGLRKIIEDFGGCDEYYTEMINAASFLTHGQFESFYALNDFGREKIVWQLTGKDAEPMAECARELCALGGIGIDLNMGCSAPEIYKSGAGISWMLKPREETERLVSEVRNSIDSFNSEVLSDGTHKHQRLSVKLRLGDENFKEDEFYDFCEMLYKNGVEQLVLHPRTKKEKLARPPRYQFVEQLALNMKDKIPVILNGNVKDVASYEYAMSKAPDASGVMIARMSAQKPWIFCKLGIRNEELGIGNEELGIGARERGLMIERDGAFVVDRLMVGMVYIQNLRLYQPKEFWETRMQRFFAYYCDNFSFGHYIKSKILNCKTLEEAETTFTKYFDEMPGDRFEKI